MGAAAASAFGSTDASDSPARSGLLCRPSLHGPRLFRGTALGGRPVLPAWLLAAADEGWLAWNKHSLAAAVFPWVHSPCEPFDAVVACTPTPRSPAVTRPAAVMARLTCVAGQSRSGNACSVGGTRRRVRRLSMVFSPESFHGRVGDAGVPPQGASFGLTGGRRTST